MIGQVIGNYRIIAELGQGGMGVVYRAEHVQLGRPAAIKVLLPQMSSDAQIVQRFFNEARAASSIDHPGIVEVYDFGRHTDGRAYLVMPLLKGESLDHRLMRPIAPLEAASLIAQVAGALAAAHARGIVHRDLKPDNIFLVPNELLPGGIQVKLLDFGIAKLTDEGAAGFRTQTGILIGTPAYMSPEQCMGRADLDHRTDLYSVGCILFHMLCGRPPFLSDQGTGVMIAMHLRDPVPDPRSLAPHVPEPLVAITLRLLEKDPAARYQSALELRQALVTAGAIAPVTAPGASPDPYGATMASVPASSIPPGHRDAYAATAALGPASGVGPTMPIGSPTTHSGAAAEAMTRPDRVHNRGAGGPGPARAGDRRGVWIALGAVLLAAGGVVAVVAATSGGGGGGGGGPAAPPERPPPDERTALAGSGAGSAPDPVSRPPDEAKPVPPDPAEAPCPSGQLRTEDTRGECCWAGQAWSTPQKRCVGAPICPPGTRGRGEQCIPEVDPARSHRQPDPRPDDLATPPDFAATPAPELTLSAAAVGPGATIGIRFSRAVRSPPGRRAWVTVAPAGSAPTAYGTWAYVADRARRASLEAPSKPGAYEVRLHTDYPARTFHLVRAVPFEVVPKAEVDPVQIAGPGPTSPSGPTPPSGQRFTVADPTVPAGGKALVRFPGPLRAAPSERFWITVIEAGSPDSGWGKWEYVPDGAREMELDVPDQAGAYELRLHANYPKQATNVVFRARLRVEAP